MRSTVLYFVLFVTLFCEFKFVAAKQVQVREVKRFTTQWAFHLGDISNGQAPGLDDSGWRQLNLPHDWSIEGAFSKEHPAGTGGGALPGGIGWYRKSFTMHTADSTKLHFIDFDGIYRNSEVWINGHFLGKRPNGYASFRYELTPFLHYGDQSNVIAVRVDNSQQPNSRWYSGSGIYRNVWLVTTNQLFVKHWGTYVTTLQINKTSATIQVETQLESRLSGSHPLTLQTTIYDSNGEQVTSSSANRFSISDSLTIPQQFVVENPHLWTIEDPFLYNAITLVRSGEEVLDIYETKFGIRNFHFDREKGFFLNDKHTKILGVCEHHDLGALGAAVNKRAIERRLEILKEMGVNAIRTAHNPPSPELLELTDRMGFIVMVEAFDAWKKNKTEFGYYQVWDEWHKRDLQDMIRRDRNHPSVMIWSIGNEILEQWDSTGTSIARELSGIVRKLDDTRPVTAGLNDPQPQNTVAQSGALDLIGYNYHNELFDSFLKDFSGEKFIATETTSALGTRGAYDMPSDSIRRWPVAWDKPFIEGNADFTVSSYDNVSTPWGSTHEEAWETVKGKEYLSGMFIWTGFDYLGEPTPYGWPARSSYFGILDLAGFPKDAYYMYQSEWTDRDVLHIFPHWNWQVGDTVDVWACSSTDQVELFLNEKSLGRKAKPEGQFHMMWRVPYKPGAIKAVAYEDGKPVMTKEIQTAGPPARVVMTADRTELSANGRDLSYVNVKVVDAKGNMVPQADNLVQFDIDGKASIVGVDNGNPISHEPFKADHRKAFNGRCQVIVQSTQEPGQVTVTAVSQGLESDRVVIHTKQEDRIN